MGLPEAGRARKRGGLGKETLLFLAFASGGYLLWGASLYARTPNAERVANALAATDDSYPAQNALFDFGSVSGEDSTVTEGSVLKRLAAALEIVQRERSVGTYTMAVCSDSMRVGRRRPKETPQWVGTTCEPWLRRDAVEVLERMLTPNMRGLEWSSGSSTLWLLLRLRSLMSIENAGAWMKHVEGVVRKSRLDQHWTFRTIEGSKTGDERFRSSQGLYYDDYVNVVLPQDHQPPFDFISVDGRARMACLRRAMELLRPEGGILLLDNSQRPEYQAGQMEVPLHWPRVDARALNEVTTFWVACNVTCGALQSRRFNLNRQMRSEAHIPGFAAFV